jgi:hypothetical protein
LPAIRDVSSRVIISHQMTADDPEKDNEYQVNIDQ